MKLLGYDPFVAPVIARENGVTLVPIDEIFSAVRLPLAARRPHPADRRPHQQALHRHHEARRPHHQLRPRRAHRRRSARRSPQVRPGRRRRARCLPLTSRSRTRPTSASTTSCSRPHVAGSTDEAQEAIGIQLANQVRDYLKLGVVQNAVNVASLTEEEYAEVSPYIEMAARLGQLLGHAAGTNHANAALGSVESISLTYNGRLAQLKTDMIRNAAIAGVLHGADGVNRINAAAAATERGIRIQEDKREHVSGGTGATLRLSIHWTRKATGASTDQGDWTGLATVLHGHSPRLLSYDGIDIEAELAGTLLVIRNRDVPGVIGRIGTHPRRSPAQHRQLRPGPQPR